MGTGKASGQGGGRETKPFGKIRRGGKKEEMS